MQRYFQNYFYRGRLPLILTLLLLTGLFTRILAQPPVENVETLSYSEGLSSRTVTCIMQDTRGFIWIATDNGLNRYDGYHIEILDNNVNTQFEIEENRLVRVEEIAGERLVLLNDRNEDFFEIVDLNTLQSKVISPKQDGVNLGKIEVIYPDRLGNVYVLSSHKGRYLIYRLNDDDKFDQVANIENPTGSQVQILSFIHGRSNRFYINDRKNGLLILDSSGNLIERIPFRVLASKTTPVDISYNLNILHEDSQGRLWVTCPLSKGVLMVEPGTHLVSIPDGFPQDEIYTDAWEDDQGRLLFGTYQSFGTTKNLYLLDEEDKVQSYGNLLEIDNHINYVHGSDFSRQLFLGTYAGFYKIDFFERRIKWVLADKQLNESQWSEGISIRSITGDGKGNIYIAREVESWYHLSMPEMTLDTIDLIRYDGQPVNLWCSSNIVWDETGYLWGGSCRNNRDGLLLRYSLSDKRVRAYETNEKVIRHLVMSKDGDIMILTGTADFDGQLLFFDREKGKFSRYKNVDGSNPLAGRLPSFLHQSSDDILWVGTDEGLIRIDPGSRQSKVFSRMEGSLDNDDILVIHESDDGRLWLGTHGGLNIFDPATGIVKSYNTKDGLCNNIVCGIVPDAEGNYWLSTFYGLALFDPRTELFSNLYQETGLTFNEFNRLAFHGDESGNFYFGTLNGLNVFKNEDLNEHKGTQYPLQLTALQVVENDGDIFRQITGLDHVHQILLTHKDDFFRLEFALPHYRLPKKNKYAAKLEGIDSTWQYIGTNPHIQLNVPPPGDYLLRIKAAPSNGVWQPDDLEMDIVVKQVFYKKTWFLILFPFSLVLGSILIARIFIRQVKRKEEQQTRINKKFAELELQALQSQMNPHFVFNSLGAIQYFIQNNNPEAADNYLAKFAKLMRLFLESSKNKYIPLSEEIKLLSLYLELEAMRFDRKFESEIVVQKGINQHTIELPSVLIQPFVENAINHGLFHKKGKGFIKLEFCKKENHLICVISDDGVGRKNAERLKNNTFQKHRSRGMQIVRERLEVLQHMDEAKIRVDVEDLYPEKFYTGTKVRIAIPLLE